MALALGKGPERTRGRELHSETELDSQPPGIAVLGQVCEDLESLLEGSHRLAERGTVVAPGASLLAVGDGFVPHLAPQGMVRQAARHRLV